MTAEFDFDTHQEWAAKYNAPAPAAFYIYDRKGGCTADHLADGSVGEGGKYSE